jgi:hypothetical protein
MESSDDKTFCFSGEKKEIIKRPKLNSKGAGAGAA